MTGFSEALQGLSRSEAQFNAATDKIARLSLPDTGQDDTVDLSIAAVAAIQARNSFEANAHVIKAVDEMDQILLDILA